MKRGEKDGNGGQWETGTRGAKGVLAAQKTDCKESVARIGRNEEAGDSEQKRPVRSPSSTPYCNRMVQPVRKREDGVAALVAVW